MQLGQNCWQHLGLNRQNDNVSVANGGSLAQAAVSLAIAGERLFQNAVILCDVTYLNEIRRMQDPLNMREAAKALYEDEGHARYLKVILNRYSEEEDPKE